MTSRATAWVIGLVGIAAVAGVCRLLDDHVPSAVTAILLLTPVTIAGAIGGARIGLRVAVIASIVFAAIFLTPFGHVRMGATYDVLVLTVFVGTGFGVGALADRRRPHHVPEQTGAGDGDELLLGAVSHELRNPLSTIRLASSDLLDEAGENPRQAELLGLVLSESERLDRIVGNLLSAGRIRAGELAPTTTPQPIGPVVIAVADRLDRLAPSPLRVEIQPDLPDIDIDAVLVEQVITNLVENALRCGPDEVRVVVSAGLHGEAVEVAVDDSGPGFPDGGTDAFMPYRSSTGSTGLGLTVCKAIVEAHGGTIRIGRSTTLGGARVSFSLPPTQS